MTTQDPGPARPAHSARTGLGVGIGIAGVAALVAVVLSPLGTTSQAQASELPAFADCDEFTAHMRDLALDRLRDGARGYGIDRGPVALGGAPVASVPGAATGSADAASPVDPASPADTAAGGDEVGSSQAAERAGNVAAEPGSAVGNAASGTNVQEAGVDEADLAKTDGSLLVTVARGALQVMDVSGDRPEARGSLDLPGQRPIELLLAGDRALVVGSPTSADASPSRRDVIEPSYGSWDGESTTLSVVDLSDPDRPEIVSSEEISARYLSARMTGDTVRVVLSSTPDVFGWSDGDGRGYRDYGQDMSLRELRQKVRGAGAADWLPTRRIVDREARTVDSEPLLDCGQVRHPRSDSGLGLLSVLSIDTAEDDGLADADADAVVGTGDLVYASADRLFVATTDGGWGPDTRFDEFGERRSTTATRMHSFDITGSGASYLASGVVDGYVYGRWAMSERDGLLRVVTTSTPPWDGRGGGSTETGVSVLETVGEKMRVVGRTGGLGLTETVRAVRWFDDLAAIVTFRQVDPLYLVDLSSPQNPRLRGELKIPGYSAYLHPVGEHRLLGIGQDATRRGSETGLQVSSFDILDVADPLRTDALSFGGYTSSPVEQDPRGFVYLPEEQLAVLPVFLPGYSCSPADRCAGDSGLLDGAFDIASDDRGKQSRTGLAAIRVADDGELRMTANWLDPDGRDVIKAMPLPGGRLVVLDRGGVTVLDADTLDASGSARYR